jgi:glycosyltransferase involved in cell wall biosynthesis
MSTKRNNFVYDTSERLNVLIVTNRFPPIEYRAISQVAYDQALALVRKGMRVTVLTQNISTRNERVHRDGMEIHYVGRPPYNVSSWELSPLVWSWAYWDYICSGALAKCFDVVHVHDLDFALVMKFVASVTSVPFISHFHICFRKRAELGEVHFNVELAHYYQYTMAHVAAAVVTVSDSEKEHVGGLLHCTGKTFVVPNGLKLENYEGCPSKRTAARAKYGLEGRFVMMWGGRVGDWMKGPDIVGQAFSKVVSSSDSVSLVVPVVTNSPPENLGYLFANLNEEAQRRTLILYPADKEELLDVYAAADVFVMPSRYEPFGLMALEAMACGLPVIVSPNGGLDEIVREEEDGLKIRWGNPRDSAQSLASLVKTLIDDNGFREGLSQRARVVARRFDINLAADRLIDIYRRIKFRTGKRTIMGDLL